MPNSSQPSEGMENQLVNSQDTSLLLKFQKLESKLKERMTTRKKNSNCQLHWHSLGLLLLSRSTQRICIWLGEDETYVDLCIISLFNQFHISTIIPCILSWLRQGFNLSTLRFCAKLTGLQHKSWTVIICFTRANISLQLPICYLLKREYRRVIFHGFYNFKKKCQCLWI